MRDFDYEAPQTLSQLTALLAEHHGRAKMLAGGTDLIDHVRSGRFAPDVVIDVKKVPELNELTVDDSGLVIGAAVPCYRIYEHPEIPARYSALTDAAGIIGGIQIQNRATLGGNLCTSSPAADSIPAMIALSGSVEIGTQNGTRSVAVEDFCTAPGKNVLADDGTEAVTSLKFPSPPPRSGSHYQRFIPRNEMDIAVVGVGAAVQLSGDGQTLEHARISLGAVAPTPLLLDDAADPIAGRSVQDGIEVAVRLARSVAAPIDDHRGTAEFRLHVVGVLVERVLNEAVNRARAAM